MGKEAGADLNLRVEVLRRWRMGERVAADRAGLERVERLAANWRKYLAVKVDNAILPDHEVGRLLMAAYPDRIARQNGKQSEYYTLANGRVAKLPKHDPMIYQPWLCAAHVDSGKGEGRIFLAAVVREEDLAVLSREQSMVEWDKQGERVVASTEKRIGTLLLDSKPARNVSEVDLARVICRQVREEGLTLLGWNEEVEAMQWRILSLRAWRPSEPWPDVSVEHLLSTLDGWLSPFLSGISKGTELKRLDKKAILYGMLPWELQNKLDVLAPPRLQAPTGSMISIQYFEDGGPPVVRVRLQEVFGLLDTPTVNNGQTKVVLHLLSPGYKPVQVTQDLRSFWQATYHEVRKELRMRYPRHSWPEEPLSATPVRGARKRAK